MARHFPIIKTLELAFAYNGVTVKRLGRELTDVHPHAVQKALLRLYALKLVRRRKLGTTTGRPKFKYRLTRRGRYLLDLLGQNTERYALRWSETKALSRAVMILAKYRSFTPSGKAKTPAWVRNRWILA